MTTARLSKDKAQQILNALWQPNQVGEKPKVYALLDGASDKAIEPMLRLGKLKFSCLYEGELTFKMRTAAPYIVRLEEDHPETLEIIQKAWGNHWGVFAVGYPPTSLLKVKHNCRKIAKVKGVNGERLVFRYYDPRVLRAYLPTCNLEEADTVFGTLTDFVMEGEDGETMHRFRRNETGVYDVNSSLHLTEISKPSDPNDDHPDIDRELDELSKDKIEEMGSDVFRQAVGLLKLEPLAHTDPNNHIKVENCVKNAALIAMVYKLSINNAETLKKLALAVELWGREFANERWVYVILTNDEFDEDEKITELFRTKAFQEAGAEAIDFSAYCILRFKRRVSATDYENSDIHIASQMALKIAKDYDISDLGSTYLCAEMILISGENFIEAPQCAPMKTYFENNELDAFQKVGLSYTWLNDNFERLMAAEE